jgi:hypothetical protein
MSEPAVAALYATAEAAGHKLVDATNALQATGDALDARGLPPDPSTSTQQQIDQYNALTNSLDAAYTKASHAYDSAYNDAMAADTALYNAIRAAIAAAYPNMSAVDQQQMFTDIVNQLS